MKVLNLVKPETSDIKFKISKFPDGQQQVTIQTTEVQEYEDTEGMSFETFRRTVSVDFEQPIQIKSRLNNWLDLELITCAVASLRELGVGEIHLYVPYIVGARSDRKFVNGENNYLKDVICPIINALNCKTVTCVDPHSDCLEMGIKNFRKIDNKDLVSFALKDIYGNKDVQDNFTFISPDAGASKKIYKLADKIAHEIGFVGDIITCSKDRDENGQLTKCIVPVEVDMHRHKIIIDDICDGGRTFTNIVKAIKEQHTPLVNGTGKYYLITTHGIFSAGFDELYKYFEVIYCTNSYSETRGEHSLPIFSKGNFVKQLNIF